MTKEREYRAYAGACLDLANKATNKKHLLAMAEAWLGLTDRIQRPVPEPDAGSLHPALRAKFGGCLRVAALRGLVAIRLLDPLARQAARSMTALNPVGGSLRAER